MAELQPRNQFQISVPTILKIVAVLASLAFLWFIRDVIGLLFVALVLASAIDPWVDRLQRWHVPRAISIFFIYVMLLVIIGIMGWLLLPPLAAQFTEVLSSLSTLAPQIDAAFQFVTQNPDATIAQGLQSYSATLSSGLSQITTSVLSTVQNLLAFLASLIFVMVLAFYMTVDEDGVKNFIRSVAPIQYQPYMVQKVNRIQQRMGHWLSGQLALMVVVGVITFIGLYFIGVEYALLLAVVAGFAEFIPFAGPIIAGTLAMLFALNDSIWKAVAVGIFATLVQQLENQVLVPKIMEKAVGLSPIIVLAAMLVGAKIAGLVGILLAIPATVILWIFIEDFIDQKKKMDNSLE